MTIAYISGADRKITVSVNGQEVQTLNVNSGGWNVVATSDLTINLNEGRNVIRLSNASDWMPDIDYIDLKPTEPAAVAEIPAKGKAERSGEVYDLSGRRVAKDAKKGIYIANGRKYY